MNVLEDYTLWKRVFLDTSIIINLYRAQISTCTDPVALFIRRLINDLNEREKKSKNAGVTFCISPLTIIETLGSTKDQSKVNKIISHLETSNVEFVNFDVDVTTFISETYYAYLGARSLNTFARKVFWPENVMDIAKEWLSMDLMIVGSAHYSDCDLILTTDIKTLYPIAKEVKFPCAIAYRECFEITGGDKYIVRYHEHEGERVYQEKKPKVQYKQPRDN